MKKRLLALCAALILGGGLTSASTPSPAAAEPAAATVAVASSPSLATFEGTTIDLRRGWGDAHACLADGTTTTCYRTEAELDRAAAVRAATLVAPAPGGVVPLTSCATGLKLYADAGFSGTVLSFVTRFVIQNLSVYGFDNQTSSYIVGACNATLYDGASGGAPTYPGSTTAGSSAASLLFAGWDNRVSSIYIS